MCPAHPSGYAVCSENVEKRTRGDGASCWALATGAVRLGGDKDESTSCAFRVFGFEVFLQLQSFIRVWT